MVSAKQLEVAAQGWSDTGKKRKNNEDSFLISTDVCLFAVADGMGGHAGGETASKLAVKTISEVVRENYQVVLDSLPAKFDSEQNYVARLLSNAFREACHEVHQLGEKVAGLHGMGTTTTALLIYENFAYLAHVGDSRAYLVRAKQITQLSDDHSLVNEQVKSGLISEGEAKTSRLRNIITRSIGFKEDVDVDMIALPTEKNDTFLLCSDGLTTMVSDEEIKQILCQNQPAKAGKILIDLANNRGGDDNITVVIVNLQIATPKRNTRVKG